MSVRNFSRKTFKKILFEDALAHARDRGGTISSNRVDFIG